MGDLEVLPNVVRDSTSDVTFEKGVIGNPSLRTRIQVEYIRLLLSIAATLPGKHRPLVAGGLGGRLSLTQTPVPVGQQCSGDLGDAKIKERKDEQLIPKYVT